MERVIVTVRRNDESYGRDLDVPAEMESGHLAERIARALGWDIGTSGRPIAYQIEAYPPGRILHPNESLSDAGVWDGAYLVLHPLGSGRPPGYTPSGPPPPTPAQGGPVSGWRPLGIDLPPAPDQRSAPSPEEKQPSGFVWKQVD